ASPACRGTMANHLPKGGANAPRWLELVGAAASDAAADVALWLAREAPLKPRRVRYGRRRAHQPNRLIASDLAGCTIAFDLDGTLVDSVVKVAPLVVNHQGQFPSVTISFNLLPGTAIGQAVSAIQQVEKELGKPLSLQTSFQGNAQAFGDSLSSTPVLIAAALFVIYLILGV
ncbi:hypothetical protein B4Q13_24835, partial [Lacticaseibacillus rhamnosus]